MIVEGSISVKAAVSGKRREVRRIYIDKDKHSRDFNYIRRLAEINDIAISESSKEELGEILTGKSHGGVGAEVSLRREDELAQGDIFYLDGIEDPFNLGYAMRTLYAFGFINLLLKRRDYTNMEGQLLKSSAGAYDLLNIRQVDDPLKELPEYKEKGYRLYSLYRGEDAKDIFDEEFSEKTLIILGGEKRGISADILKLCDETLYIPYASDFRNALNAAAALDVTATILYSQRKKR